MIVKKQFIALLFPIMLLVQEQVLKMPDDIIGYKRVEVYKKMGEKPDVSNNLIDGYDIGYMVFYSHDGLVDSIMISTRKKKHYLS